MSWAGFFRQLNIFRSWMAIPSRALLQQLLPNRICSLQVFLQGDKGQYFWKTYEDCWFTTLCRAVMTILMFACLPLMEDCDTNFIARCLRCVEKDYDLFYANSKACQHTSIQGGRKKPLICSLLQFFTLPVEWPELGSCQRTWTFKYKCPVETHTCVRPGE